MSQSLFIVIATLGIVAALGTVLARNLIHAALFLIGYFFVVACQFVLLEAEFLAAIQVLVYIGAVAILLMFGIMLTRNIQGDDTTTLPSGLLLPALVASLGLFFVLAYGINDQRKIKDQDRAAWRSTIRRPSLGDPTHPGEQLSPRGLAVNDMGKTVGDEMLTRYAVPFEVAGLLLTAALVGAVALAHRDPDADENPGRGLAADRPVPVSVPLANGDGGEHLVTAATVTPSTSL